MDDRQENRQAVQTDKQPPQKPSAGNKKVTILILLLIVAAAIAITISQQNDGPLPTWEEIYTALGFTEPDTSHANDLAVHFIDVGQGDSILVQAPTGESLLIDAGENGSGDTVTQYIDQYGDETLEYVIATHPHSDHIDSLDEVIDAHTVQNIIMPRLTQSNTPTTSAYRNLLTSVKKSGAKVIAAKPGFTFSIGKGLCTVLAPIEQTDDLNNLSVVLRLDWGDTSFLFTGDAESVEEKTILKSKYADYLDTDVLKMGHHGSRTSSSSAFLKAVTPDYCVISCGVGNDYGHPHKETMQKLEKLDVDILRTDTMGSVRFYSDGQTLSVECDKDAVHN